MRRLRGSSLLAAAACTTAPAKTQRDDRVQRGDAENRSASGNQRDRRAAFCSATHRHPALGGPPGMMLTMDYRRAG